MQHKGSKLNQAHALSNKIKAGLVCFRLRGPDELNQMLLSIINKSGKLHMFMVPASINDKYVIRFCICAQNATEDRVWCKYQYYSSTSAKTMHQLFPLSNKV